MDNGPIVLSGRYEVGELVGRGGMAEVHIGHDNRLGRTVAIKILRSDLARDPSFLARFRREAQAAASLNHPAIVAVYDTGEDNRIDVTGNEVHVPFIVMEYVEGHTVREILRDDQAVPIDEAIEITAGVLNALEYSHLAGIVHRDIKPANVMITPTGAVKVMDFGIARAVADSAATMTQTQAVIGTAQYLSPEQARGETVDARSDLYSTGCLLFELLTGRPPFSGDSPVAIAYQHVREPAPAPSSIAPDVPEILDRITLKALAKNRDDRYSSASEFHAHLDHALRGGALNIPVVPTPVSPDEQPTMLQSPVTQVLEPTEAAWPTPPVAIAPTAVAPVPSGPDDDEDDNTPPRRQGLMWTLITIAVVAIGAIAVMLMLNFGQDEPKPEQIAVPTIEAGMSDTAAKAAIEKAGLVFERISGEESADQAGTATGKTDPQRGTAVDPGSTVKVWFYSSPGQVTVPDVTGMDFTEASAKLAEAGLVAQKANEPEDSPDVDYFHVTRTEPGPGKATTSGSTVTIYLSSGQVNLPALAGMSKAEAERTLTELMLTPQWEEVESDQPEGTVVDQEPGAGSVKQKSTVVVKLAKAMPEPTPTPTPTTKVPKVSGYTIDEAETELGNAQLEPGDPVEQKHPTIPAGKVISTDPPAGTEVPVGSSVTLYVSLGP